MNVKWCYLAFLSYKVLLTKCSDSLSIFFSFIGRHYQNSFPQKCFCQQHSSQLCVTSVNIHSRNSSLCSVTAKGVFTNHVCIKGQVGGQQNAKFIGDALSNMVARFFHIFLLFCLQNEKKSGQAPYLSELVFFPTLKPTGYFCQFHGQGKIF